ncbi:MAG: TonB-dependent receptor [Candidatus Kapabacteria bacterium]|nr:TonB-dependent receptor [Candidatus Kapabacteria bacterium]
MKYLVILLFCACGSILGQQTPPPSPPNQPIELPEFIVTGKERVDIPAGSKSSPSKPASLKGALLDSLNDLEKQPMPTMSPDPLLRLQRTGLFYPGYATASFGQYLTPALSGGYVTTIGGYRLDAHADIEASDGHVTNASYSKIDVRGLSTYVAPEKFLVFGGSTTEADLRYRRRGYRLFAVDSAPDRSVGDLSASVFVDGKYEGYRFQTGASWSMIEMSTAAVSATDNVLSGHLAVDKRWKSMDLGGRLDVNVRSWNEQDYSFVEGSVYGRYSTDVYRVRGSAGIQSAAATRDVTYGGLLLQGVIDWFVNPTVTVTGSVRSGLRPYTLRQLLDENPYITDTSLVVDVAYDIVDLQGGVVVHPHVRLTATASLRVQQRDRHPIWTDAGGGLFNASYHRVTMLRLPAQLRWIVTGADVLTADIEFVSATVGEFDVMPYQPSIRAAIISDRTWSPTIASTVRLTYVGDRWADLANTVNLTGYLDLHASVRYNITPVWQAAVEARNILGSDIMLWNGYIERGLFVNASVLWRF